MKNIDTHFKELLIGVFFTEYKVTRLEKSMRITPSKSISYKVSYKQKFIIMLKTSTDQKLGYKFQITHTTVKSGITKQKWIASSRFLYVYTIADNTHGHS